MPSESKGKSEIIDQAKLDILFKDEACVSAWNKLLNLKHELDGFEFELVKKTMFNIAKDVPSEPAMKTFVFGENLEKMQEALETLKERFKRGDGFDTDNKISDAIKDCREILKSKQTDEFKQEIQLEMETPRRNSISFK